MLKQLASVCLVVPLVVPVISFAGSFTRCADTQLIVSLRQTEARPISPSETEQIANAIYTLEGGAKTRYPYGIKSLRTRNPRQVCINTIEHAWRDFHGQGTKLRRDFLYFLADRYCPPSVDRVGNKRWKKNITKILKVTK